MLRRSGFAPIIVIILLLGASTILAGIYLKKNQNKTIVKTKEIIEESIIPTPTPKIIPTPKPSVSPIYKKMPTPTPTPTQIPSPEKTLIQNLPLPTKTPTPAPGNDNKAPITNIYYPSNNNSITYKLDGKVCAVMTAPIDSIGDYATTYFSFDNQSNWTTGAGYLCVNSLPNGPHTLYYYSVDQWGNKEDIKTLNFTVNIAGN